MDAQTDSRSDATVAPRPDLDLLAINTIRTLAIDAVEKANSGHPGAPMALAPVAYTLWSRFLRYDPADPTWPNRDRFVLSAGHASMLLYALLHLSGVRAVGHDGKPTNAPAVSLDDIKAFREVDGVCAGHPEFGLTGGVETTTGPLGQGAATSVGMALSARWLAARYNTDDATLFDHNVYAVCSDGDLMEGVASEAASVAGQLGLANLCWIWDDNQITIEGPTDIAFRENVVARFRAYGWATVEVADANDVEAVAKAVERFLATPDRPTLIAIKSVIGYGSPGRQGTSKAHSDPMGAEEIVRTKAAYGWPTDAQFLTPDGVADHFHGAIAGRGGAAHAAWRDTFARYATQNPDRAAQLSTMFQGGLPAGWDCDLPVFAADAKGVASREAGGKVLNALAARIPWMVGGSADLGPSNKTTLAFDGAGDLGPATPGGRNVHFGVREHAMGAIANGMSLSGLRAYAATFFVFADYMKPAIRLAALMERPVVFVFTHDSIGVGQDGPTHQPIEQLASLRATPNLLVLRPADANEATECWRLAMEQTHRPSCLVLSRQALPTLDRSVMAASSDARRGAYVVADAPTGATRVILIGTGAEVGLCVAARAKLAEEGIGARVVSMPSWELFEAQDRDYQNSVLVPDLRARVAVEAASPLGWDRYVGRDGEVIAMRGFGASGPDKDLMAKFGFTVEAVVEAARRQINLT